MPYQPLTEDQFNKAKESGFSADQIIGFEKQRKGEINARENPDFKGGATSPANIKAQQDLKSAQGKEDSIDNQVGINQAAYNYSWPLSLLAKKAMGDKGPNPQPTGSGSKILSDMGDLANPATGEALKLVGKTLGFGGKAVSDVMKYANPENRIGLAQETRNAVFKSKDDLMSTFGGETDRIINQSDKAVKLEDPINNFMEESKGLIENKDFNQDLKLGNPQAKRIANLVEQFGKEDFPKELPAKDVNDLSKYIKNIPGIKNKLTKPPMLRDFTNDERILLNLSNDLKESVIAEHPDLQSLNEHYAETINDIKSIRGNLKPNQTIGNLKNYSFWDDELKKSFERQVPKETVSKIKDYEKSDKTAKLLKSLGLWGAKGAAGAAGFRGVVH